MKIILLAAGYGTRVYPYTLDCPKALLAIKGKPLLDYLLDKIPDQPIHLVSNEKFFPHFKKWLSEYQGLKKPRIKLISDGTLTEQTRLGAIKDIQMVIKKEKIDDDILVTATDELFDGKLDEFIQFAKERSPAHSVMLYKLESKEQATRFGIAQVNAVNKVINFEEKPKSPRSLMACKGIYYFPREKLALIDRYLEKNDHHKDAPGYYIAWLCQNDEVFAFVYSGRWFDIGNRQSYLEATNNF